LFITRPSNFLIGPKKTVGTIEIARFQPGSADILLKALNSGEPFYSMIKFFAVVPAKAGIRCCKNDFLRQQWIPAFAGMTGCLGESDQKT
jgi:hypothetical protein